MWIEAFHRNDHLLDPIRLSHNTAPIGGIEGSPDTGDADDTGPGRNPVDDTGTNGGDGCGCSAGPGAPGAGIVLGLAALARRRRQVNAS